MRGETDKNLIPTVSVVVPAFNSSSTLIELGGRIETVFNNTLQEPYELIIIDDGSINPETWSTCLSLANNRHVVAVRLMRNYGKAAAILCGFKQAKGKWVLTIDDDLQQRPEDIPLLYEERAHDVVIGHFNRRRHSLFIRISSRIKMAFDKLILQVPVAMSPMKLIRREVVLAILEDSHSRPFIPAILCNVTKDFVSVPVTHEAGGIQESRFNFKKRIYQFSDLIIGNSSFLLRAVGAFGVVAATGGFLFAVYTIFRVMAGQDIPAGWASLIVINLTFSGLILIALGLNGEYLLRTLESTHKKSPYKIKCIAPTDS